MEFALRDLLGETALELNPRALRSEQSGTRTRVAFRAGASEAELRSFLGDDLRLEHSPTSPATVVADFSTSKIAASLAPSSPRARALMAAALARAAPTATPRLLAVLNVTPDSFSDGGRWDEPAHAVERGLELIAEGAHALDVGGESTRPGASPVGYEEESRRVLPVIRELARQTKVMISIDTTKARVAAEALDAGASMVNDISAGRFDPEMIPLVARGTCSFVLMHMQGTPQDMQRRPSYVDVVDEVLAFLRERASEAWHAGIASGRLWVDPGIGFGKTLEHNLALLANCRHFVELASSFDAGVLIGTSRKQFLASLGARSLGVEERLEGSIASEAWALLEGVSMVRVHDVAAAVQLRELIARPVEEVVA